jgi:hypothetical protein
MRLGKYSFGIGDRFTHQGRYQLKAILKAKENGINIVPVWNKSNREHNIIGTSPRDTRAEADDAVSALDWQDSYYVDADHINMNNVSAYIDNSDFFTIDVADYIGHPADISAVDMFVADNRKYIGLLKIPGINERYNISEGLLREVAGRFLYAAGKAASIYQLIKEGKGNSDFIPEVSMDEVDNPQNPVEMFFILSALARENLPVQTIAPKFTGRFNKGIDYQGDIHKFTKEFEQDLLVIDFAISEFGLPGNLKLSVHSGSDKFSIYPVMGKLIRKHDKGIHIKTAGTTWLEEVIGLAEAGGSGLELAKKVYSGAYDRKEELCKPYATVIDIDESRLPSPHTVSGWDSRKFADTLRHIPGHPDYNPGFRQLIHVGYKVAAEMGNTYYDELKRHAEIIGQQVYENIWERHIKRLFFS